MRIIQEEYQKSNNYQYFNKFYGTILSGDDINSSEKAHIVMEYCSNGDLDQVRRKIRNNGEKLTGEQAFWIARELLKAITLLHKINIAHLEYELIKLV